MDIVFGASIFHFGLIFFISVTTGSLLESARIRIGWSFAFSVFWSVAVCFFSVSSISFILVFLSITRSLISMSFFRAVCFQSLFVLLF